MEFSLRLFRIQVSIRRIESQYRGSSGGDLPGSQVTSCPIGLPDTFPNHFRGYGSLGELPPWKKSIGQ